MPLIASNENLRQSQINRLNPYRRFTDTAPRRLALPITSPKAPWPMSMSAMMPRSPYWAVCARVTVIRLSFRLWRGLDRLRNP